MTPTQAERAARKARRKDRTDRWKARRVECARVKAAYASGSAHGKVVAMHYLASGNWHRQDEVEGWTDWFKRTAAWMVEDDND